MVEPCSAGLEPASQTTAQGELLSCWSGWTVPCRRLPHSAAGSLSRLARPVLPGPPASQRPNSPIARPNSNPTPPFPAPNRSGPVSKPFLIPLGAVSALSQSRIIHIQNRGPNYVQTHLPTHIQRRAILVALLLRLLTRCNPAPASFRRPSNSIAPSASLHHLRGPILLFFFCFFFCFQPSSSDTNSHEKPNISQPWPLRPSSRSRFVNNASPAPTPPVPIPTSYSRHEDSRRGERKANCFISSCIVRRHR